MPVTGSVDEPIDRVTIANPAADDMEHRCEATSNPKIAARDLRRNLDDVRDELFAEVRALPGSPARPFGTPAARKGARASAFYISDRAIEERASFVLETARALLVTGTLPGDRLMLREGRIPLLTRGYFLLNKAYKDWRIAAGHANEPARIAALQAMTIARFQPFIPVDPRAARDLRELRCNEIFALVYALGMLKRTLVLSGLHQDDFWLRVLDIIAAARLETLDPFIDDINRKVQRPLAEYNLVIHPNDKPSINSLISIFELVAGHNGHRSP